MASLSVVAIARHLGIAPMAIYNYFPSRDALMQELSARLLSRIRIDVPNGTPPMESLAIWARCIRAHFLRHPELLQILGYDNGYASAAWLDRSREVVRAFAALGYADDSLAHAIRWYWNVVMSAITVEVRENVAPVSVSKEASLRLDGSAQELAALLGRAAAAGDAHEKLFEFHLHMALSALEARPPQA